MHWVMRERFHLPPGSDVTAASFLTGLGFAMKREAGVTNFRKQGATVSVYATGTVILICSDRTIEKLLFDFFDTLPFDYEKYVSSEMGISLPPKWIGSDEAGKGDYFGPLVVTGVCLDTGTATSLYRRGITDSKKLSPEQLGIMESKVRTLVQPSSIESVVIYPEKYNELHEKMGNVLDMMVWAHSKVIGTLSKRCGASAAVVDKFSTGRTAARMKESVPGVDISQFTKGEREIAVAAASIVASSAFRAAMASMSRQTGINFIPGAGGEAKELAARIRRDRGEDFYRRVAKADFII